MNIFRGWKHLIGTKSEQSGRETDVKVNLLGGAQSLGAGLAIYRVQVSADIGSQVIIVSGRDEEFSGSEYMSDLDEQDIENLKTIKNEKVRQKTMAGRVLRRKALAIASEGKVAAKDWRFETSAEGKPFVKDEFGEYSFSVTHCDGATFVAVSTRYKVGFDAEAVEGDIQESLIKDVLSEEEQRGLENLDGSGKGRRFFELWTLKEAYTKLIGTGLATDVRQIAFELKSQGIKTIGQDLKTRFMTWSTFNGSSFCQMALALR